METLENAALSDTFQSASDQVLAWIEVNAGNFGVAFEVSDFWEMFEPVLCLKKKHRGGSLWLRKIHNTLRLMLKEVYTRYSPNGFWVSEVRDEEQEG